MKRIGIFLSVFDVHANRAPSTAKSFITSGPSASFSTRATRTPRALTRSARWGIRDAERATLVVRQITGAIARRIVAWSKVGDSLRKGERFGMIRFGSRTEIYLSLDAESRAKIGDRVAGGAR